MCVYDYSPSVCHTGRRGSFPFALDKHFLSVNIGEPGTPQFPDKITRMHRCTLTCKWHTHTQTFLPSCCVILSHSSSFLHILLHNSHMLHAHTQSPQHNHTVTPTHHPLYPSPSAFRIPPSCTNTSALFYSHIFTHRRPLSPHNPIQSAEVMKEGEKRKKVCQCWG